MLLVARPLGQFMWSRTATGCLCRAVLCCAELSCCVVLCCPCAGVATALTLPCTRLLSMRLLLRD